MSVSKSGKSIVLFRKNNLDAFYAAFIYWWLFGKDSVRPTDTIVAGPAMIRFQAVDVFENRKPNKINYNQLWTADDKPYIGNGDTVLSIGLNIDHYAAASAFFSYENDATFHPEESIENCQYYYDQSRALTDLMLESLIEAKHLSTTDKNFQVLNQFFQFYSNKKNNSVGFYMDSDIAERVVTYFPQLRVEDFKAMSELIEDPIKFMENRNKKTPEVAVREHVRQEAESALQNAMMAPAYQAQTGIPLRLINTQLSSMDTLGAYSAQDREEAILVYRFVTEGVRARYYSSIKKENALAVFPIDRPKIGNSQVAEWLISVEDFYSLHLMAKESEQ